MRHFYGVQFFYTNISGVKPAEVTFFLQFLTWTKYVTIPFLQTGCMYTIKLIPILQTGCMYSIKLIPILQTGCMYTIKLIPILQTGCMYTNKLNKGMKL